MTGSKILEEATRPGINCEDMRKAAQEATQPKRRSKSWKRKYRTLRKKGVLR